jgi:uncharacterized membrane protein
VKELANVFEAIMVVSFGLSWPLSIIKSYKARTTKSKSLPFLLLILFGYAMGIASKFIGDNVTYVTYFYILNFCAVATDLGIYFRNLRLDKLAEKHGADSI